MSIKFSGNFKPISGQMKAGDLTSVVPFTPTTWDTDPANHASSVYTLSNDNLTVAHSSSRGAGLSVDGISSGKVYFEWVVNSGQYPLIGITTKTGWSNTVGFTPWEHANSIVGFTYVAGNTIYINGVWQGGADFDAPFGDQDVFGLALDLDVGAVWFSREGVWTNGASTAEVEAGNTTNALATGLSGEYFAQYGHADGPGGWVGTANFGATPFANKPNGFTGWGISTPSFDALTMESGTPLATEAGVELALE